MGYTFIGGASWPFHCLYGGAADKHEVVYTRGNRRHPLLWGEQDEQVDSSGRNTLFLIFWRTVVAVDRMWLLFCSASMCLVVLFCFLLPCVWQFFFVFYRTVSIISLFPFPPPKADIIFAKESTCIYRHENVQQYWGMSWTIFNPETTHLTTTPGNTRSLWPPLLPLWNYFPVVSSVRNLFLVPSVFSCLCILLYLLVHEITPFSAVSAVSV